MDELERELKVGFLDEAAQLLEDAEQYYLQLETAADDPNIISAIFRLAHNLKGSGRAVGFSEIAEFTHVLESLLLKIKNNELKPDTGIVNLLLRCSDHLKAWMETLRGDLSASVDSAQLVSELNAYLNGQAAPAPAPVVSEVVVPPADAFPEETTAASIPNDIDMAALDAFLNQVPGAESPLPSPVAPTAPVETKVEAKVETKVEAKVEARPAAKASEPKAAAAAATEDESVRVSLRRLEALINNVGELVILQTVLNQQRHQVASSLMQRTIVQLAKITKDIQDISMGLRMIPLKQTFQKMQRIVRDTSKALNKEIDFEISGEQTELDKTVVDQLGDPLVHLIRNSVDHGIESTEDRIAAGKPAKGKVRLSAFHRGGQIVIEVADDGKGLDAKKLIQKAIEKGVLKPDTTLSDRDAYQLIFAPGFSTKQEVTEVSGRGVGMDVVKTNIEKKLQGEIQLETELGKGTTLRIILPLTLAIIEGMVVKSGEERYIVPLAHVYESLQPKPEDLHFVSGLGEVLNLRGEQIPLYRLGHALGRKVDAKLATECIAIVVRSSERPFSVLVDDIIGQQQIVIKQLGQEVRNLKGVSGGAILGDGRAALILELNDLVSRIALSPPVSKSLAVKGAA